MTSQHFKELLQLFDIALFFKAPDQPEFFCSASETARLAAPHTKNRQEGPIGYHRAGIANLQFSHFLQTINQKLDSMVRDTLSMLSPSMISRMAFLSFGVSALSRNS